MSSDVEAKNSDGWRTDVASRPSCLDNPVIAAHLEAIRALCREYGVLRLEAFGTVCTPDFDPGRSDVDFLVEYSDDYDFGLWLTRCFELKERLESLMERPVDLVMVDAPRNAYFAMAIDETRQIFYAARDAWAIDRHAGCRSAHPRRHGRRHLRGVPRRSG